jgi:hypothetical protein
MSEATIRSLEQQLDALVGRLATLEWRQERMLRALAHLIKESLQSDASADAAVVASSAAARHWEERRKQATALETLAQQERTEKERDDAIRSLKRRLEGVEGRLSDTGVSKPLPHGG